MNRIELALRDHPGAAVTCHGLTGLTLDHPEIARVLGRDTVVIEWEDDLCSSYEELATGEPECPFPIGSECKWQGVAEALLDASEDTWHARLPDLELWDCFPDDLPLEHGETDEERLERADAIRDQLEGDAVREQRDTEHGRLVRVLSRLDEHTSYERIPIRNAVWDAVLRAADWYA